MQTYSNPWVFLHQSLTSVVCFTYHYSSFKYLDQINMPTHLRVLGDDRWVEVF